VLNLYGPSEDTTYSTAAAVQAGERVTIGRPLPGKAAYVLDGGLRAVPPGALGELALSGVGLARGYLGRPELTAERFLPDPYGEPGSRLYRTGDLVRQLPDGRLDYLGRLDHQVKLRGFRIELGEIEALLEEHPDVARAAAVVQERATGGRALVAFASPPPGQSVDASTLLAYLKTRLPQPSVPSRIDVLAELPLNPNGKVDRQALAARRCELPVSSDPILLPRDDVERAVADLWRRVLGLQELSVEANFFDVGGDSLQLLELQGLMRERFPGPPSVVDLFRCSTVAAQARFLAAAPPSVAPALRRASERGRRRLAAQEGA